MPDTAVAVNTSAQASSAEPVLAFGRAVSAASMSTERRHGMPASIPSAQRYFWSRVWQQGETETDQDIAQGDVHRFEHPGDAIRWLLAADAD